MVDIAADRMIHRYLHGDAGVLTLPAPYYLYVFKILEGPLLTPTPIYSELQPEMVGMNGPVPLHQDLKGVPVIVGYDEIDPYHHILSNHELSREEIIRHLGEFTTVNGEHQMALVDIQPVSESERLELMEYYNAIPVEGMENTPVETIGKPLDPTPEVTIDD